MTLNRFPKRVSILLAALAFGEAAFAGKLLDYIRNYDLNDYALGVAISGEQIPYVGGENSRLAYPVLTSFRDSAFTKDWLLLRDGDIGVRWVSPGEWELGVLGRVQTLGFGNSDSPLLIGLDDRLWGLEVGPMIGYRGWPVHVNFKSFTEVLGRQDGWISYLTFTLPREYERGYLVPGVEMIQQNSAYTNYYFGITPAESNLFRPAYTPNGALNTAVNLRWGYSLSEKWLLYGSVGLEFLDSEITESPIVDRSQLVSANISIAYNNNVFQPRYSAKPPPQQPKFELRVGAFWDSIDSVFTRDSSIGNNGSNVDLEDLLGLPDEVTLANIDATYRLGHYHRLEAGYLGSTRSGKTVLEKPIKIGDQIFPAGTVLSSHSESRIFRVGYAYMLINDSQKEVGIMGGLHFSTFATDFIAQDTGQSEHSNTSTPLPVIGLHGALALGERSRLGARIQFFRMDFDRYEGSLNFATLDWQRRFGENFRLGLGYNYYSMNLTSRGNKARSALKIVHYGPEIFVSLAF